MAGKTKHGHVRTRIVHHGDGSHTIHHQHGEGSHKDVQHAVADLDGVHDSMQDHIGPEAPAAPAPAAPAPAISGPAAPAPAMPASTSGV
jgi:hypothetical protein